MKFDFKNINWAFVAVMLLATAVTTVIVLKQLRLESEITGDILKISFGNKETKTEIEAIAEAEA